MLSHKLKYRIEIWSKGKPKNSMGAVSPFGTSSDELVETVYADMTTEISEAATNENRVLYTTKATFIIRNYPEVSYNHYIRFNNDTYRILGIQQLNDNTGQIIKAVRNES